MTSTTGLLSFCLLVAGLGSCSEPRPIEPEVPRATLATERRRELPPQQTHTTAAFMREHASEALDMRRAIIAGRFDQLHRVAAIVANDAWSSRLRPDYVPHVTAVRDAATAALDSTSTFAAGAALGALAGACGACHRAAGGPSEPARPADPTRGASSMAAHAAAEQALWEGLVTPSVASWRRGAESLANAPELASDIEEVSALAQHVNDLALKAAAGGPRADLYGSILTTCSTCHRRLDIQPE